MAKRIPHQVVEVKFRTVTHGNPRGRFTVPRAVCRLLGVRGRDYVGIEVDSGVSMVSVPKQQLRSGTEVYGLPFNSLGRKFPITVTVRTLAAEKVLIPDPDEEWRKVKLSRKERAELLKDPALRRWARRLLVVEDGKVTKLQEDQLPPRPKKGKTAASPRKRVARP